MGTKKPFPSTERFTLSAPTSKLNSKVLKEETKMK